VDQIDQVVTAFRDEGDLYKALAALEQRWPDRELTPPPWRRVRPLD